MRKYPQELIFSKGLRKRCGSLQLEIYFFQELLGIQAGVGDVYKLKFICRAPFPKGAA